MAYSLSNPPSIIAQGIGSDKLWKYVSADSAVTVGGAGYFSNGHALGMRAGDIISVVNTSDSNSTTWHAITSSSASAVAIGSAIGGPIESVPSDSASGPNLTGGPECYISDATIHSCVCWGGYTNNPNTIGASFVGINGGGNDTYIAGTADYSGILGGYDNYCNGLASWIASQHGRIYTAATHASIFGGSNHYISAGDYGVIAGGTLSKITSSGANNAMLGGSTHTISGTAAGCAIVGGYGNTLSASYSSAISSYSCTLSAASTAAIAAQEVTVSAVHAIGMGLQTTSYIQGGFSYGARRHAANGDSQCMSWHQSQSTTDAGTADLSPYGSANLVSIPINSTWAGTVFVVARQTSTGNRAAWKCDFVASKAGSGNVIIDAQTWTELFDGITLANPSLNPSGSSVFRVRCAGAAAAGSILWSSRVDVISITG